MLNSRSRHKSICISQNLGLVFDSRLNFQKHISQTCRACFYHICDLRRIRKKSDLRSCQTNCSGIGQLQVYYNSLFYNIPDKDIARLHRVQNRLARVVTKAPRFSLSTPTLKRKFLLSFKICTITFRALKNNQPAYLADLLVHPKCSKIYAPQIQIDLLFLE